MRELHVEGLASHNDPESCANTCEGRGEALIGAHTGWALSPEIYKPRTPTLFLYAEGEMLRRENRERNSGPAGSQTPCTCGTSQHGNREILGPPAEHGAAGRNGKAQAEIRR